MPDPRRRAETEEDTDGGPARRPATGPRRWGVVLGIILAVGLIALMVLLHLTGTIGPGAH